MSSISDHNFPAGFVELSSQNLENWESWESYVDSQPEDIAEKLWSHFGVIMPESVDAFTDEIQKIPGFEKYRLRVTAQSISQGSSYYHDPGRYGLGADPTSFAGKNYPSEQAADQARDRYHQAQLNSGHVSPEQAFERSEGRGTVMIPSLALISWGSSLLACSDPSSGPAVNPSMREYQRKIIDLEQGGERFEFTGVVLSIDPELQSQFDAGDLAREEQMVSGAQYYIAYSEDIKLHEGYKHPLDWYYSEGRDHNEDEIRELPAYQIRIERSEDGKQIQYRVENWISGETIFSQALPDAKVSDSPSVEELQWHTKKSFGFSFQFEQFAKDIAEAIRNDKIELPGHMQALRQKFDSEIQSEYIRRRRHSLIEFQEGDGISQLKAAYKERGANVYSFYVIEQDAESTSSAGDFLVQLPHYLTGEYGQGSLKVNGIVNDIKFQWIVSEEPGVEDSDFEKMRQLPRQMTYTDDYGNLIFVTHQFVPAGENPENPSEVFPASIVQVLNIFVPTPLNGAGDQDDFVPISIDLSEVAGPKLENIIYHRTEHVRYHVQAGGADYAVYATNDSHGESGYYDKKVKLFAEGVALAEQDFGLNAGELVQKIVVIDIPRRNAHFSMSTEDAVFVSDELLRSFNGSWYLPATGYHEAVHALNHVLELHEDEELQALFESAPEEFFDLIKESNWNEVVTAKGFGGHPRDNLHETIASFLNTVRKAYGTSGTNFYQKDPKARAFYVKFGSLLSQKIKEKSLKLFPDSSVDVEEQLPILGKIDKMMRHADIAEYFKYNPPHDDS